MSLLGIFIVGLLVAAIVLTACGLLVAGIRADMQDRRENYGEEGG